MRAFITRCRLRNGVSVVLTVIATSSCSAIVIAQDTFGDALQVCSARPA
jgi:hypothetical protein